MAYRGGGFDAGAGGGGFGHGESQGKNNYTAKPKTRLQKTYSILANVAQGFSKMVTVGRQQNAEVKAGLRDPANFSTPGNDGDGRNTNSAIPLIAATAPTTAEVSQATATDATNTNLAEDAALRKKKAKATGRSMTILTSSKGVTSDQGLTLGKKSLLGA